MNDKELRNQLVRLLTVRQAHMDFEDAVRDFPMAHINTKLPNSDYTFWHLLEHMRICQLDILEFMVSDEYRWPNFPVDLWPDADAETTPEGWQQTIDQFIADRQKIVDVINDPSVDLFARLPNNREGHINIVQEINTVSSHNAYHTGELGISRHILGIWYEGRKGLLGE